MPDSPKKKKLDSKLVSVQRWELRWAKVLGCTRAELRALSLLGNRSVRKMRLIRDYARGLR